MQSLGLFKNFATCYALNGKDNNIYIKLSWIFLLQFKAYLAYGNAKLYMAKSKSYSDDYVI